MDNPPDFIRTKLRTASESVQQALDTPVAAVEPSTSQYEPSLLDFTLAQTIGHTAHQEL